jgi:hypothetical protein
MRDMRRNKLKRSTACKGADKDKLVVGLVIVRDLSRSGERYKGGTVLDPEDGKVYTAEVWLEEGKLKLRAYVGFIYRTQIVTQAGYLCLTCLRLGPQGVAVLLRQHAGVIQEHEVQEVDYSQHAGWTVLHRKQVMRVSRVTSAIADRVAQTTDPARWMSPDDSALAAFRDQPDY